MLQWCLIHPWMTFFIIFFMIFMIGVVAEEVLIVINNKLKLKEIEIVNKK